MQCASCRFENMPGLASCGRCGSPLNLDSIAIDVHPPRASRASKRLRRWIPRRSFYRARDHASEGLRRTTDHLVVDQRLPLPERGTAHRLLVPGWAHLHMGLTIRGWIFLGAYLLLLVLGMMAWGNGLGAICLGLAFGVHVSSVLDALVRQGRVPFPAMVATSVVVSIVLGFSIYMPAGWVLSRTAAIRAFDGDAPPFARGDVVLFNRWAFALRSPRPGDVVLFHPVSQATMPVPGGFAFVRWAIRENELIDRVVGGPGDRVRWDDGRLTINGVAASWKPLIPAKLPGHLDITVPEGRYLILPTTSQGMHAGMPASDWERLGFLSAEDIQGVVYLRLHPLERLWFIR
jgi:signal peptidase I